METLAPTSCLPWLAKSRDGQHPVLWHSHEVASVAKVLVQRKGYFSVLSADHRDALCLLAGLHDIGKISACFARQIGGGQRLPDDVRHDALSLQHLRRLAPALTADLACADPEVFDILIGSVCGHHGRPVDQAITRSRAQRLIGPEAEAAADDLVRRLLARFPEASLAGLERQTARSISTELAGFTTHADWIASNPDFFPMLGMNLDDTPDEEARQIVRSLASAEIALTSAGFRSSVARPYLGAQPFIDGHRARPLQTQAEKIGECPILPDLMIIEDQTGAGKTEAALTLAHAFIASGRASGVFFALPTMATSNALHARVSAVSDELLSDATVGLVHGHAKSWLEAGSETQRHTDLHSTSAWLTLETRRNLLSDIAVGTIDQAMASVLRSKHYALRHHALRNKVLIIDEVHEADPYMQDIIAQLLVFRGRQSLPTILMSATLPLELRDAYANAYRSGQIGGRPRPLADPRRIGRRPASDDRLSLTSNAYPCISTLTDGSIEQVRVDAAMPRSVAFERLDGPQACLQRLIAARNIGANAVWIRNSVDEAIAAFDALSERGIPARLIHSRFTGKDRRDIEQGLQRDFGPNRPDPVPGAFGQIVIATQVIEAGLDLDFDVMISDLAPMAPLLQRQGRQFRHLHRVRPTAIIGGPVFCVNAPDPARVQPGDWLETHLGLGRFIYDEREMWATLKELESRQQARLPQDTRSMVEASLSHDEVPSWIIERAKKTEVEAAKGRMRASQIIIDGPTEAYGSQSYGSLLPEVEVTTRLGRPQITLAIVPARNGRIEDKGISDIEDSCVRFDLRKLGLRPEGVAGLQEKQGRSIGISTPEGIVPVVVEASDRTDIQSGSIAGRCVTYSSSRGLTIS